MTYVLWPTIRKFIYFLKCFHAVLYTALKTMFHSRDSPRLLVCDTGLYSEQNDIGFITVAICGGYISKYPGLPPLETVCNLHFAAPFQWQHETQESCSPCDSSFITRRFCSSALCRITVDDSIVTGVCWPGVGVTKAPFVNFSVSKIFDLAKVPVIFFESLSYLTGITAAQLRRYLSNINVIFNI